MRADEGTQFDVAGTESESWLRPWTLRLCIALDAAAEALAPREEAASSLCSSAASAPAESALEGAKAATRA